MTFRTLILAILALAISHVLVPSNKAHGAAPAENAKIEALIRHLESLKEAKFIRNGTEYDAKTAAKFLRGKWHAHEDEVKTAQDFIEMAASRSATSGKPYIIHLSESVDIPCADYLAAQLNKQEAAKKE